MKKNIQEILQQSSTYTRTQIKNKKAFTLIEVIVAVTIFSIMMISMMSVYYTASDITYKADMNRTLHENMKNITVNISEDVMKNGIKWVSADVISSTCGLPTGSAQFVSGNKFCSETADYYLAKKDDTTELFTRATADYCEDFAKHHCYLVKDGDPLTNDLVTVEQVVFYVTDEKAKKVTMNITLRPAPFSGVRPSLAKTTKLINQLTLTERKYNR